MLSFCMQRIKESGESEIWLRRMRAIKQVEGKESRKIIGPKNVCSLLSLTSVEDERQMNRWKKNDDDDDD